jgi:SIR2-like domain
LYKLHASLDWVEDEELGICSIRWPQADRAEEVPENYDALLIFAAASKFVPRDPYLSLLVKFLEQLFRCECVVILGYSFGDEHVNTMLVEAMRKRPKLQCVIANRQRGISDYLPSTLAEEFSHERFHNIAGVGGGDLLGVRAVFEQDVLLRRVKAVCEQAAEEQPF